MNEFLKMYFNTLFAIIFLYFGIYLFEMYLSPSTQNRVLYLVFGVFFLFIFM